MNLNAANIHQGAVGSSKGHHAAGVNRSQGNADGNSTSWRNTHVGDMANHSTYQGDSIDISGGGSIAGCRNWRAWG